MSAEEEQEMARIQEDDRWNEQLAEHFHHEDLLRPLSKETIDRIFKEAGEPNAYIVGLFKAVMPEWNMVKQINGYPKVSKTTSEYLWSKAYAWDKMHVPDMIPAANWMNRGFATDTSGNTPDWVVNFDEAPFQYKGGQNG